MLEDVPTTNTCYDAPNALCLECSSFDTTAHQRSLTYNEDSTTLLDCRTYKPREIVEVVVMDVDVPSVVRYNEMDQGEAITSAVQPIDFSIDMTTDATTMKTCRNRASIPSALVLQDHTHIDILIDSEKRTIAAPVTSEMTKRAAAKVPPPAKTLKRKKRLSLSGLSVANNGHLAPPERSPPLSPPPPENSYSYLPFLSAFPATLTPPGSPNDAYSAPENLSPSIVVSTPTSIIPIVIEPSRPIPPLARTPPQTALPRIGTPKRPYYSTVRANMNNRANSSPSHLSAPSTSLFSSSFSSTIGGGSRLTASDGALGEPDRSNHLDVSVVKQRSASIFVDSTRAEGVATSGTGKTHQPISSISTVPPLSPVMAARPTPNPIPVQAHLQPSSPARSILSALDPACGDEENDDDGESDYNRFGISSARFSRVLRKRRSSGPKEKDRDRGDGGGSYFSLSLPLSLGRKRGRTLGTIGSKSERETFFAPAMPTLSPSRSYNSFGGFGNVSGSGYSMSGEIEMRMALAERNLNANGGSGDGLAPAFKFRESLRPSCDGEHLVRKRSEGSRLMRIRSSIGQSSTSLVSPPPSPSKPNIGSKLKEMSASFFGKFSGGNANRS